MQRSIEYITKLTSIPSPTGFTKDVMDYIMSELKSMGLEPHKTPKGNVMVTLKGETEGRERLVTAHCDTLGAMVKKILPSGRIMFDLIGGFTYNSIENDNVIIHTRSGKKITGTILLNHSSVHVYRDAGTLERNQNNMEVRIDEVTKSEEDTRKLGIEVGDFISFDPKTIVTESGFIKSRHLDDKASAGIILSILKKYTEEKIAPKVTTHFAFSCYEEIGHGMNSNIPENVIEYMAVDMGAIGENLTTDEYVVSICVKDSSGPYNYELRHHLIDLCEENKIPYAVDIYPYYGSDASGALTAGYDIKHGLFGAGIESSHAYERTHEKAVEATFNLLDKYLRSDLVD